MRKANVTEKTARRVVQALKNRKKRQKFWKKHPNGPSRPPEMNHVSVSIAKSNASVRANIAHGKRQEERMARYLAGH